MLLWIKRTSEEYKRVFGKRNWINGWVKKIRSQKNFGFIELNDGTFFRGIQVVFEEGMENFEEISKLTISSSIKVAGIVVESLGKGQDYEIKATKISVYQKADSDYPLQNKRHSFEFLRTIAHLRPRTNAFLQLLEYVQFCRMQFINLSGKELCVCANTYNYWKWCRRCWRNV